MSHVCHCELHWQCQVFERVEDLQAGHVRKAKPVVSRRDEPRTGLQLMHLGQRTLSVERSHRDGAAQERFAAPVVMLVLTVGSVSRQGGAGR